MNLFTEDSWKFTAFDGPSWYTNKPPCWLARALWKLLGCKWERVK